MRFWVNKNPNQRVTGKDVAVCCCAFKCFTSSSACKNVLKTSLCLSSGCEAILLTNKSRAWRRNSMNSLLNRNFSEAKEYKRSVSKTHALLVQLFSNPDISWPKEIKGKKVYTKIIIWDLTNSILLWKGRYKNAFVPLSKPIMQPFKITIASNNNFLWSLKFREAGLQKQKLLDWQIKKRRRWTSPICRYKKSV